MYVVYVCIHVCTYVCMREREKERYPKINELTISSSIWSPTYTTLLLNSSTLGDSRGRGKYIYIYIYI